ncbi:hypothetical protein B0A55_04047 [Friedmanniomyces simplex]|uniref:Macro-like domain-containing protein n=1 Tax=Friedmanniomyces simplex TaxID=329884 RepID=A0A4U0XK26_9PEZI|nr:hypothetical protein B0A55_04047 [Friedmanniomyces simplex]
MPDPSASTADPATTTSSTSSSKAILPSIHLLCMLDEYTTAFTDAVTKHCPTLPTLTQITHHNCSLKYLPEDLRFDAVVSPANSYARLDGAFDDALARAYGPRGDYGWITRKAQKVLYEEWRGLAPPGTCTVVPLDHDEELPPGAMGWGVEEPKNPWGTEYLLLCPTMRIPWDVKWDREVVYECVWSLLCAVDNHNRDVRRQKGSASAAAATSGGKPQKEIKSILMTPLATGVGRVSAQRWAEQCVIAMKHYGEAIANPRIWGNLQWEKAFDDHEEVVGTYKDDV